MAARQPPPVLRVFISSPGDVAQERAILRRILARIEADLDGRAQLEVFSSELEGLSAQFHPQDPRNIPSPRHFDVVVVVLWMRLGTRLPAELFRGAESGAEVTGTEWEFEEAVQAGRQDGRPHLLVYRRTGGLVVEEGTGAEARRLRRERMDQQDMLDNFCDRWLLDPETQKFHRPFETYLDLAAFEAKVEPQLRSVVSRQLQLRLGSLGHAAQPFLGLRAYSFDDAALLFGRTRVRGELRDLLLRRIDQGSAALLVLGASGNGKSSLVMAGLLPDLYAPGVLPGLRLVGHAVMRPLDSPQPLAERLGTALAEALGEPAQAQTLSGMLAHGLNPAGLVAALLQPRAAAGLRPTLALVLDQAEELFARPDTDAQAQRGFVTALAALAASGQVIVLGTMRSDFYPALEAMPELIGLVGQEGQYLLLPPDEHEIGQIIRRPAQLAGLAFEDDPRGGRSLDQAICDSVVRDRAALPLLGHLLLQLWLRRTAEDRLTWAAYADLGGVEGAIAHTAEEVLERLCQGQDEGGRAARRLAVERVMRALVAIAPGEDQRATARTVPLAQFPPGSAERLVVEAFIAADARLLVTDTSLGQARHATLRVTHEALFTHWPFAQRVIAAARSDLTQRDRVEEAARVWHEAAAATRADFLIPAGAPLALAEALWQRHPELLSATAQALLVASLAAEAERRQRQRAQQAHDLGLLATLRLRDGEIEAALADALRAMPAPGDGPEVALPDPAFEALEICLERNQLLYVHRGHAAPVMAVALAPDGVLAASGADDGSVQVWHCETGALMREYRLPAGIRALAWDSHSGCLAAADATGTVRVWHAAGELAWQATLPGAAEAWGLGFAAEDGTGRRLVLGGGPGWLLGPDGAVPMQDAAAPVATAASAAGACLALGRQDGGIMLRQGAAEALLAGHRQEVARLRFDGSGTRLASTGMDKTVRVWDVASGASLHLLEGHALRSFDAAFSPDATRLASASGDRTARIWELGGAGAPLVLRGHRNWVYGIDWRGERIVTGSRDATARVWKPAPGLPHAVLGRHEGNAKDVSFSPDGQLLASAGDDGCVRLWHLGDNAPGAVLRGHSREVRSVRFLPDGARLVSGSWDGTARLWQVDGSPGQVLAGHAGPVRCVAAAPCGRWVATASFDGTARLWDAQTGACLRLLEPGLGQLYSLAFNPAGTRLALLAGSGQLLCLNTVDWQPAWRVQAHQAISNQVVFAPDGASLATAADDGGAALWATGDGALQRRFQGHADYVTQLAFHPVGAWLATASFDRTVRLWCLRSGQRVSSLRGHAEAAYAVAFHPQGESLATASHDQTVRLWRPEFSAKAVLQRARALHALMTGPASPEAR